MKGRTAGTRWAVRAMTAALCLGMLGACGDDRPPAQGAPKAKVIGFLRAVATGDVTSQNAILSVLSSAGYHRGQNLRVLGADPNESHPDPADAKRVVAGWMAQGVDLVFALSSTGAKAAHEAAPDLDVLFLSNDPMAVGLVRDERHPEGRLTGATFRVPADRTLDLVRRVVPNLHKVGLLYPPADPSARPGRDNAVKAAAALSIELVEQPFAEEATIAPALRNLEGQGVDAILLTNSPTTSRATVAIGAAMATSKVPVIANTKTDFALLVLEPDVGLLYRQMGRQAARLLKGTPVADVPVEDPGGFKLRINDAVASRLGITVPADVQKEAAATP